MPPLPLISKSAIAIAFTALGLGLLMGGCASREERIEGIRAKAAEAFFAEKPAEAATILAEGLDKYPDANELRIDLSRARIAMGDLPAAVSLLEAAVAQDQEKDALWVKIGELHATLGNPAKAIEALETYVINHGDDFLAYKALAIEREKLGRLTDAIKAATRWNQLSSSAQSALKLGQLYQASANMAQARSWFGQAAAYQRDPAAKEALAELIRLETNSQQFQQASVWLETYRQRFGSGQADPRIREAATVLESFRRAHEEIARAAESLTIDPLFEEPALPAETEANAAPSEAPTPDPIETAEATAAQETPAASETIADGDNQPAPIPPEALFDDPPANETASAAVEAAPQALDEPPLSEREAVFAAFENGDYAGAIAGFWQLLGDSPDDAGLWSALAQAYYGQQSWFDAEACILQAKSRAPQDELIANLYLNVILKTQTARQAIAEMRNVQQDFPGSAPIALTLARALRDNKAASSDVASAYQRYLALASRNDPGYAEASRYLQSGQ